MYRSPFTDVLIVFAVALALLVLSSLFSAACARLEHKLRNRAQRRRAERHRAAMRAAHGNPGADVLLVCDGRAVTQQPSPPAPDLIDVTGWRTPPNAGGDVNLGNCTRCGRPMYDGQRLMWSISKPAGTIEGRHAHPCQAAKGDRG